ncbi:integumentary mucin C.1-like [Penaeus monodon]|uniref:integumentary mucin C.1-like n=1 Tax=Penaeus monodon TaxID=6687 RepID=UPI0018A7A818|nr:integumentary mucin C.1-like [Penaeus monodon]
MAGVSTFAATWGVLWACAMAAPALHTRQLYAPLTPGKTGANSLVPQRATGLWQLLTRVDEDLSRSSDFMAVMLESGEEEDLLSRLLYEAQEKHLQETDEEGLADPEEVQLVTKLAAIHAKKREPKQKEESVNNQEEILSRRKRMGGKRNRERGHSKERRTKCKGRSRERGRSKERCEEEEQTTTISSTSTSTTSTSTTTATPSSSTSPTTPSTTAPASTTSPTTPTSTTSPTTPTSTTAPASTTFPTTSVPP